MAILTRLYDFLAGTPAVADQVDAEFNAIIAFILANCVQKDGSLAFTSAVTGVTPTAVNHLATKSYADGQASGTLPVGFVAMYGTATPPTGWLLCDGAAVARTTYANLFAVIGTSYGAGDGSTTFNLPSFQQRFPIGYKLGVNAVGAAADDPSALGTFQTSTPTLTQAVAGGGATLVAGYAHKHIFVPPYAVIPFVIKY